MRNETCSEDSRSRDCFAPSKFFKCLYLGATYKPYYGGTRCGKQVAVQSHAHAAENSDQKNWSVGGFAARRTQWRDISKAETRSSGEEARAPSSGVLGGLQEKRRKCSEGIGNGVVAVGKRDVEIALPRRG